MNYTYHEAAAKFPRMNQAESLGLQESLKKNGQIEDIVLCNGEILDGISRYEAGNAIGMILRFRQFGSMPGDGTSQIGFIVAKNLDRRMLTTGQRSACAEEMVPYFEAEAVGKTQATAAAAAKFGVSERSVRNAALVKEVDSTGFAKVKSGETTLNEATKNAKQLKKEAKEAEAKALMSEAANEAAEAVQTDDETREKAGKALEKVMGEAFALAVTNGIILKKASELQEFMEMHKDDKKLIGELIIQKWKPAAALKFMMKILDGESRMKDFILQAICNKRPSKFLIDGHIITIRKASESEPAV